MRKGQELSSEELENRFKEMLGQSYRPKQKEPTKQEKEETDVARQETPQEETPMVEESSTEVPSARRISGKQRRASLDEYKADFMCTPKIDDRKPVFISREKRDRLNRIVGLFGDNRMSVSGMVENIIARHLQTYGEDIEAWRKL